MKKLFLKKSVHTTVFIVSYLLVLVIAICAITIYPLLRQKVFFINHAYEVANNFQDGHCNLHLWETGLTRLTIIDSDGQIVDDQMSIPLMSALDLSPYLDTVLTGNEAFALRFIKGNLSKGLIGIAGVPIYRDGKIIGAAFYIRKIISVIESAICFILVFSILYWIGASILISSLKKQQKYEDERERYIDNVTHALKTPVASVRVLSEALCDGVVTDPYKQQLYYGLILNETTRQTKMIQEILDLSKLQSGKTDTSKSVIQAKDLFPEAFDNYIKMFDLLGINLHISSDFITLPNLFTNRARIIEIIQILLDNEAKYVPEGNSVWIDVKQTTKNATICIKDDGDGIPEVDLPHIFERFYKGKNTDANESSGLGLAIALETANCLNEKLWAENNPDKGAAFYFTIRLA